MRIPQNAAVVGGGADSVAGVLGMGGSEDGTVCMICGTSTAILGIRQNIRLNAENGFFVTPLLKAHTVGMEADILSSGNTQKWLLERIQEIRGTAVTHKELSQMASQAPAGADGLYFMPYLAGGEQSVLWDEELKGSLIGLNLSHRVSHIVRACYEGICFEALRCIKAFAKDGYEVKQVIVTPVSSDSVFMQILADILGVSCKVSRVNNASAMGAALLARIGVMGEARCEENSEIFSELYSPDKQRHKRYEAIYSDYKNASANAKLQKLI